MEENQKMDIILSKLEKIEQIENDIKEIKTILEKEIRGNIKQIAEKNYELSRNMHNIMETKDEVIVLGVKVRMLESEVRELKRKIL